MLESDQTKKSANTLETQSAKGMANGKGNTVGFVRPQLKKCSVGNC